MRTTVYKNSTVNATNWELPYPRSSAKMGGNNDAFQWASMRDFAAKKGRGAGLWRQ